MRTHGEVVIKVVGTLIALTIALVTLALYIWIADQGSGPTGTTFYCGQNTEQLCVAGEHGARRVSP